MAIALTTALMTGLLSKRQTISYSYSDLDEVMNSLEQLSSARKKLLFSEDTGLYDETQTEHIDELTQSNRTYDDDNTELLTPLQRNNEQLEFHKETQTEHIDELTQSNVIALSIGTIFGFCTGFWTNVLVGLIGPRFFAGLGIGFLSSLLFR
jgi:hypothetical protein